MSRLDHTAANSDARKREGSGGHDEAESGSAGNLASLRAQSGANDTPGIPPITDQSARKRAWLESKGVDPLPLKRLKVIAVDGRSLLEIDLKTGEVTGEIEQANEAASTFVTAVRRIVGAEISSMAALIEQGRAEVRAKVAELHKPRTTSWTPRCMGCGDIWPCPTAVAAGIEDA